MTHARVIEAAPAYSADPEAIRYGAALEALSTDQGDVFLSLRAGVAVQMAINSGGDRKHILRSAIRNHRDIGLAIRHPEYAEVLLGERVIDALAEVNQAQPDADGEDIRGRGLQAVRVYEILAAERFSSENFSDPGILKTGLAVVKGLLAERRLETQAVEMALTGVAHG